MANCKWPRRRHSGCRNEGPKITMVIERSSNLQQQQQQQHVAHSQQCPLVAGAVLINLNVANQLAEQQSRVI